MNIAGIEGIITASGWDDDGSIISISLKTSDDEIAILMDEQARKLIPNLNCFVRLSAVQLHSEEEWRPKIKINSFEIIKRL